MDVVHWRISQSHFGDATALRTPNWAPENDSLKPREVTRNHASACFHYCGISLMVLGRVGMVYGASSDLVPSQIVWYNSMLLFKI